MTYSEGMVEAEIVTGKEVIRDGVIEGEVGAEAGQC
jgi:hypothetical protein